MQVMHGKEQRNHERSPKMNFLHGEGVGGELCCRFTTLAKDSRYSWSLFGSNAG